MGLPATAACTRSSRISTRCCAWPSRRASSDVFVHCFMDGRDTLPKRREYLEQLQQTDARISASARSPPIADATTPWIATSAGSAKRRPSTRWSSARAKADASPIPCRASSSPTSAASPTNSSTRFVVVDGRGEPVGMIRDDDVCIFSTSAPTAGARSRVLRATATSLRERLRARRRRRTRRDHSARPVPKDLTYICMTQYDKHFRCRSSCRPSPETSWRTSWPI